MIEFHYAPTPNGWKIAIMLYETGLFHCTRLLDLPAGDQFKPEFLSINPNGKIPAIVDHDYPGGPRAFFESGAILLHLAERTGMFLPRDPDGRQEAVMWLFWQASNLGPMAGQLSHFVNYSPKDQIYSKSRYQGEYERCLGVLERRLSARKHVLGDAYSIADMMIFPWVFIAKKLGTELDRFPAVNEWRDRIKQRAAVVQAINLYKDAQFTGKTNAVDNGLLFNQNAAHVLATGTSDD